MQLLNYLVKRTLQAVVVLLGVAFLVFLMFRIIPGNPVYHILGDHATSEAVERLTEEMNLDQPMLIQFFEYVKSIFTGDMGTSVVFNRPVSTMIKEAFPNTLKLAIAAAILAWVIGIGLAIYTTITKRKIPKYIFNGFSILGISVPVFMIAMLLQFFLAFRCGLFPVSTNELNFSGLVLPAVALGWINAGKIYILAQSLLKESLDTDFAITARAKGATRKQTVLNHALRNSFIPILTMMSMQIASLLSGAVITETVFSINGLGRLAVDAITARDVPVVQATVLFTTLIVIVFNLISDCLYVCLDKRTEGRWKY